MNMTFLSSTLSIETRHQEPLFHFIELLSLFSVSDGKGGRKDKTESGIRKKPECKITSQ